jgi:DNA-binding CsgD family transcriptional regulator
VNSKSGNVRGQRPDEQRVDARSGALRSAMDQMIQIDRTSPADAVTPAGPGLWGLSRMAAAVRDDLRVLGRAQQEHTAHPDPIGAIRESIAAGDITAALAILRDGWDTFLQQNGPLRSRELYAEFDQRDLLSESEAAAVVWLLNAVPPETDTHGTFATRVLSARDREIEMLTPRARLTVRTASIQIWLSRGYLDRAEQVVDACSADLDASPDLTPAMLGPVYAEFLLASARARLMRGSLRESGKLFAEALAFRDATGETATAYRALAGQGLVCALNAEFDAAQEAIDAALDAGGPRLQYSKQAVELLWGQALVWAHQDRSQELDLAAAQAQANAAIHPAWRLLGQILEARVLLRDGLPAEAAVVLRTVLRSAAAPHPLPLIEKCAPFLLGLALLKSDQPSAALQAVDAESRELEHVSGLLAIKAFALIARGKPEEALRVTEPCIELGHDHPGLTLIYVLASRAIAFELLGLSTSAENALSAGLGIATRAGIRMDREMFTGAQLDYLWRRVETKLSARLRQPAPGGSAEASSNVGARLARLTAKEREVLVRLAGSGTLAEIAAELFVSENTLKTHTRNIYRKLEVNSRIEVADLVNTCGL